MADSFIGEIRIFAGNFAPRSWALCDGQLLAVSQNNALFSLLGTTYGGDGRTTFGLPDLRGRIPIHYGSGPGLTPRSIGSRFGTETETLTANQIPPHTHNIKCTNGVGNKKDGGTHIAAGNLARVYAEPPTDTNDFSNLNSGTILNTGGQAHDNLMPSLCVNFIICLSGIYPSRS
jgi:microcystin-dependent protein